MSKKSEMTGAQRKSMLLEAGAKLASKYGTQNVTRRMVAKAAKVSEGLVSLYLGDTATAQKAYARKARALKLTLPSKAEAEAIGVKLRKHKPADKRDTRKRTAKEVNAIKRKRNAAAPVAKRKPAPANKAKAPPLPKLPVPQGPLPVPPERKSAARKPKAPPSNPPALEAAPSS